MVSLFFATPPHLQCCILEPACVECFIISKNVLVFLRFLIITLQHMHVAISIVIASTVMAAWINIIWDSRIITGDLCNPL